MRAGLVAASAGVGLAILSACAEEKHARPPVTMVPLEPHAPDPGAPLGAPGKGAPARRPAYCNFVAQDTCYESIAEACQVLRCPPDRDCVYDDSVPANVLCRPNGQPEAEPMP